MKQVNGLPTLLSFVALLALFAPWSRQSAAEDATDVRTIMQAVEDRSEGQTRSSEIEMQITAKNGDQRIRKLRSMLKETEGLRVRALYLLAPADVKDTALLTNDYENIAQEDEQWLYLPSLKKTKRIPTGDQSNSFLGSDFSYADLTRVEIDLYDYKLMRETQIEDKAAWQIEAVPRSKEEARRTGYSKAVLFVRKDNYVIARAVYFMSGGRLKYLDVRDLQEIKGVWVATEVHMTTKQGDDVLHKTVLLSRDVKVNEPLDENMLTVRGLEKGV